MGRMFNIILCFATVWSTSDGKIYDWFDAQELCRNSSKRLTTDASDSLNFIWTGRHKRYSKWIKILGCYENSDVQGKFLYNMTDYQAIGLCQEHCLREHYSIYALKATECRCLQSDFKTDPLPPYKCNSDCFDKGDDSSGTECGGEDAFNVFSTELNNNFKDTGECMALVCSKPVPRFQVQDCGNKLGIICSTLEEHTENKGWRDSIKTCKSSISTNSTGHFDLSNAEEACKIINRTSDTPLWIGIFREEYVSENQGEPILDVDRILITKCQKCKTTHCEFVMCFDQNITEVNCTAVSTSSNHHSRLQGVDIKLIIGPAIAALVVGATIVILSILCRRKKQQCKRKRTPSTPIDTEVVQKRRKFSNKYTRFTKDDIRHLGHSNPSYIMTDENVKEQKSPKCTSKDAEYDELHKTHSRKIERSDIFHYSLHLPYTYDAPIQNQKKERIVETGYDVAFKKQIPESEFSEGLPDN